MKNGSLWRRDCRNPPNYKLAIHIRSCRSDTTLELLIAHPGSVGNATSIGSSLLRRAIEHETHYESYDLRYRYSATFDVMPS